MDYFFPHVLLVLRPVLSDQVTMTTLINKYCGDLVFMVTESDVFGESFDTWQKIQYLTWLTSCWVTGVNLPRLGHVGVPGCSYLENNITGCAVKLKATTSSKIHNG